MEQLKELLAIMGINFVNRTSRVNSQMCMYSLMYSTLPRRSKLMTEACSCLGKNCCFTESWFWFFLGGNSLFIPMQELIIKQTKAVQKNSI